jgi:hypothetical protein
MDAIEYDFKIDSLLSDLETYEPLRKDPTNDRNKEINTKMRFLLDETPELYQRLNTTYSQPTLPYMYGVVKTHKPGNPLRPIISSIGTASYKLSKWLVKLVTPLIGQISNSAVKNTTELIYKVKQQSCQCKLISFDVVSLFTKVPIDDLLEFLKSDMPKLNLPISGDRFLNLIKLCIKDNIFRTHDNRYFKQVFGTSMGNPLSATLANIYMEYFEKHLLPAIRTFHLPWYRYVDDVLCMFPENKSSDDFLVQINTLVPSIKFKKEEEQNNSITFLDTIVIRENGQFCFKVYRKPSAANAFIHYFSQHQKNIKVSVLSSMFLRAFRICSPNYLNQEINTVKAIGKKLFYPDDLIEESCMKAKRTFNSVDIIPPEPQENKRRPTLVIPYFEGISEINRLVKNFDIDLVYSYPSTIKSMLIKNSPSSRKGIIYSIPCGNYPKKYIGQTGRDLKIRLKEHRGAVSRGDENNASYMHMELTGHDVDWNAATDIASKSNRSEREILEACIIKSLDVYNISPGVYSVDEALHYLISKQVYFKKILEKVH